MKKTIFIGIVTLIASMAQAYDLTKSASATVNGNDQKSCEEQAIFNAHISLVQSCENDYGMPYRICNLSHITRIDLLKPTTYNQQDDKTTCEVRIFVNVWE